MGGRAEIVDGSYHLGDQFTKLNSFIFLTEMNSKLVSVPVQELFANVFGPLVLMSRVAFTKPFLTLFHMLRRLCFH